LIYHQTNLSFSIPQGLPPHPFYGKIMTGAVATRGAASYGLLLPAANYDKLCLGLNVISYLVLWREDIERNNNIK
jgi:hypothetical protein